MRRLSNELVWTAVLAIVCGIVLASLLTESGWTLLLIVLVVGLGLAATFWRRRSSRIAAAEYLQGVHNESATELDQPPGRHWKQGSAAHSAGTSRSRRTGVRSNTLGTQSKEGDGRRR